jgi:hypothetical protein
MADRLIGPIRVIVLQLLAGLTVALVLCGQAHAQPVDWSSYQQGRSRVSYYQGTASNGEQWTGQSHTSGHTTYFDAYGPNGQTQHCTAYKLGLSAYTDCPVPLPTSALVASAGANPAKHGGRGARRVATDTHAVQHSARDHRVAGLKARGVAMGSVPHLSPGLPNSSAAQ